MKNKITKVLSRKNWEDIVIKENKEPLVEIEETDRIKIGLIKKQYEQSYLIRKTLLEKLKRVSENLPKDLNLLIIEGFRSVENQKKVWNRKFIEIKEEKPELFDEEIEKLVGLIVARPLPLANHNCGGAIDVTLINSKGDIIDMGTPYPDKGFGPEWHSKFKMLSEEITEEQKENRKILREAMEKEEFVWYPGEWWHYCWGDRMWAVYSNQKECFYGPAHDL